MNSPLAGGRYEIIVSGELHPDWSQWFEGFEVEADGEATRLVGQVIDQPALHGVLAGLRDLGIPIVSVNRLSPTVIHERAAGNTSEDT